MMSKLSLGGKASASKLSSWVEPAFGELFPGRRGPRSGGDSGDKPAKRRRVKSSAPNPESGSPSRRQAPRGEPDEPWVERYAPRSQAELAVHKKKVEEVETWLTTHLDTKASFKGGTVLLLTGPSGCGKTATVQVLAKELDCRVQEWCNPNLPEYRTDDSFRQMFDPDSRFNGFQSTSQTGAFQDFLLRANKYNHLQMKGDSQASDRKVILVEDFPNQFYRQPGCLHDILRSFARTGRCPLVFIVSDSQSGDRGSRLLFPKDVQDELAISNISFNPVAPTSMMKLLSRIVTMEAGTSGGRVSIPDKSVLEQLCSGSSGDVRSAINSLQFSSLNDLSLDKSLWTLKKGKIPAPSRKGFMKAKGKSKSSQNTDMLGDSQAIGGKDASLFLFRALGKILYCKRETFEAAEAPRLPAHLSEHQRDKLLLDPELVVERSHMSGELFSLYLQQNYTDFFSDVDDIARASEYLSDADFLTAEWSSRTTMLEYGTSVATRGLIHSNSARAKADSQSSVGFRPLHKPHWLLVSKKHKENCHAAQSLFISFCLNPVSLQTELLPYLAKLSNPMRNPAQIAFIQDVAHLPLNIFSGRLRLEALTDKDPGLIDTDSENEETLQSEATAENEGLSTEPGPASSPDAGVDLPMSQPQPTTTEALLEEEDLLIEEYESD
ncbi:cell cycle checkpoint protein RAD17 isoform X2 [Denticeps clupeoides]|uniref:cell cycle checkpoint protein RAD17 isoform X2 n=1 Tax=Denticeps clupeoides TaxID=299321 RepID=UPI0010A49865|nr:cell cycle checkpoint protein RAD17 isoform X2 [Denticeps clupeoides]